MPFPCQLPQMFVEQIVGDGHEPVVPLWIARLIAAEQEQRRAARIKRVEHPQVAVLHLASQLLRVGVPGSRNHIGMRPRQGWAAFLQQFNLGADFDLLIFGQGVPPGLELAGELDFPCHGDSIPCME
ncbi:MAG TPA: hypothetical protein VKH18_16950 [Terriglobales bacterium]|nr:hypothetical protein [Terriglobales bacterium]